MKREKQKYFGLYIFICIVMLSVTSISCGYANQKTDKQFGEKNDSIINRNMIDSLNSSIKVKSDKYFKLDKVTIILAKELDSNSNIINIQDYVENGKSFFPVFSSPEEFKKSTQGVDIGKKILEIDPYFFLSLLSGKELLRINPNLPDEIYFNASDLKIIYKSEIESTLNKLLK